MINEKGMKKMGAGTEITNMANASDILAGLANIMDTADSASYRFLQFSGKEGRYKYRDGDNEKELVSGTRLLVDQNNIRHGYKCWKNNDVVDTFEVEATQKLPDINDMEDFGPYDDDRDGWQSFIAIMLKAVDGDDVYRLEISSVSGRKSVGDMIRQIQEKAALHSDGTSIKGYAVVEIGSTAFKSRNFKNYKPVFTIVDWDETTSFEPKSPVAALTHDSGSVEAEEVEEIAVKRSRKG